MMHISLQNTSLGWFLCFMKKQWRNDALITKIARRLKDLRVEKNLSQEIVYFNTGIHIGKIETEKYNITVSTLSKLCDYYGVTLEEFFRGIKTE